MKKALSLAGYGVGGAALVGGSFVLFAALSGAPLSQLPAVGGLFPEPEPTAVGRDGEVPLDVREELAADRRPVGQLFDRARSPLHAFLLPSPFSVSELEELESRLENRMRELDARERALDERERELVDEREHYRHLFAELEELRNQLARGHDEQQAREQEIERDRQALEEAERASFQTLAAIYSEGRARDMAGMLSATYEPEKAALVLAALDDERAATLLAEIHRADPERGALYVDAYRRAQSPQPPASK